jgi:hypothetical protein
VGDYVFFFNLHNNGRVKVGFRQEKSLCQLSRCIPESLKRPPRCCFLAVVEFHCDAISEITPRHFYFVSFDAVTAIIASALTP